jgi:hypothetical protein
MRLAVRAVRKRHFELSCIASVPCAAANGRFTGPNLRDHGAHYAMTIGGNGIGAAGASRTSERLSHSIGGASRPHPGPGWEGRRAVAHPGGFVGKTSSLYNPDGRSLCLGMRRTRAPCFSSSTSAVFCLNCLLATAVHLVLPLNLQATLLRSINRSFV